MKYMASLINIENNKHFLQTDYPHFLQDILTKIQLARYDMLQSVSRQTVLLYWEIGRAVSENFQTKSWGKFVVKQLSKDLQTEFPDIRGFSVRNIWNMKKFYEFYSVGLNSVAETQLLENSAAVAALNSAATAAELQDFLFQLIIDVGWTQNCIILEKCKNLNQIVFYLKMTKTKGWSKLDLLEKIEKNYFENYALAQNNFEETVPKTLKAQVAWEFLDDYNIELLNPDKPIAEKTLENAIINNIVKFLHEMGGNFAFVGRQFRLELDEKEYFVDLLFFNITLNCYVVFELKAREFSPKDFGQTQMYMQLINKQVKQAYHNPTIGVIVCRTKNRLEVEYMLEQAKDPMGVATYNRYDKLPEEYAKYLPSEEEITKRLAALINIDDEYICT
jgi:predicted nuclease of restriction endonuclease-like (RecB) superfamily